MSDLISNEQAIQILKPFRDMMIDQYRCPISSAVFALDKAIEALKSEPCEDAVSRKAVYDAMVEKGQRSRRYKLGEIWELNGTEIREALDTVPSVTPKQKGGKNE